MGFCKSENPYELLTQEREEWRRGWEDTDYEQRVDDYDSYDYD